jgi:hypothetical protein
MNEEIPNLALKRLSLIHISVKLPVLSPEGGQTCSPGREPWEGGGISPPDSSPGFQAPVIRPPRDYILDPSVAPDGALECWGRWISQGSRPGLQVCPPSGLKTENFQGEPEMCIRGWILIPGEGECLNRGGRRRLRRSRHLIPRSLRLAGSRMKGNESERVLQRRSLSFG